MPAVVAHFCGPRGRHRRRLRAARWTWRWPPAWRRDLISFAGPGKISDGTRAGRRRRHRDQHGIRARDAALAEIAQRTGVRPSVAIRVNPDFELKTSGHEDGRRAEAVRRRRRTRAADAGRTRIAAARVLGLPHLQRLAEPAPRDPDRRAAEDRDARDRAGAARARACAPAEPRRRLRHSVFPRREAAGPRRRSARTCGHWCPRSSARCPRPPWPSSSAATWSANPACTSAA